MRSSVMSLLFLTGCAPGTIAWPTGHDQLRTALYREVDAGAVKRLQLVLSNGTFGCDLPAEADPVAQQQALLELQISACRENARHVAVELLRGDGSDWVGLYPGDSNMDPAQIAASRPRLSNGSYYGIDEAALSAAEDFVRTYAVVEGQDVLALDIGDGGEVEISGDGERLRGRFEFPMADLSGTFRAESCETGTLFDLLVLSPVASCPVVGEQ